MMEVEWLEYERCLSLDLNAARLDCYDEFCVATPKILGLSGMFFWIIS
jgi:hypothetical protein